MQNIPAIISAVAALVVSVTGLVAVFVHTRNHS